jgi:hypothetical protein
VVVPGFDDDDSVLRFLVPRLGVFRQGKVLKKAWASKHAIYPRKKKKIVSMDDQ